MAELVACRVFEHSEDIACTGGAVMVEGQKEGQKYRFCTNFHNINGVLTQHVYSLPIIP